MSKSTAEDPKLNKSVHKFANKVLFTAYQVNGTGTALEDKFAATLMDKTLDDVITDVFHDHSSIKKGNINEITGNFAQENAEQITLPGNYSCRSDDPPPPASSMETGEREREKMKGHEESNPVAASNQNSDVMTLENIEEEGGLPGTKKPPRKTGMFGGEPKGGGRKKHKSAKRKSTKKGGKRKKRKSSKAKH